MYVLAVTADGYGGQEQDADEPGDPAEQSLFDHSTHRPIINWVAVAVVHESAFFGSGHQRLQFKHLFLIVIICAEKQMVFQRLPNVTAHKCCAEGKALGLPVDGIGAENTYKPIGLRCKIPVRRHDLEGDIFPQSIGQVQLIQQYVFHCDLIRNFRIPAFQKLQLLHLLKCKIHLTDSSEILSGFPQNPATDHHGSGFQHRTMVLQRSR